MCDIKDVGGYNNITYKTDKAFSTILKAVVWTISYPL